ncbi:MAG: heme lyase CcmF/NrfE family subunit [Rhodopila sp.]
MIPEMGHYALALAVVLAGAQACMPLWGVWARDRRLMGAAPAFAFGQLIAVGASFLCLVWSAISDDFSALNVAENSATLKPLLYKVTGTWGDHEGSILLWCLILSACGGAVAGFGRNLSIGLRTRVLGVLGATSVGFLLFSLTVSDPFVRLWPPPLEGRDMNPLLQDPGLALHPPVLYAGYVGFSIPFAFAVAALMEGRVDAAWARWVRPWTLASWCFLTGGIALGSWWAYYDLGWGGYWFWDPVENASLLPWLTGTALLHSAVVVEKREALKAWTVLLAIATFSLSLTGTFMVRSGLLNSVHTFASDPTRGVFILGLLAAIIGGSLALFALRAGSLQAVGVFTPLSREGVLVLNNVLLCSICAVVFVGTAYPPLAELVFGAKLSVGAPYFNLAALPLSAPLFAAMPFGLVMPWKRAAVLPALQRVWWAGALAVAVYVLAALGLGHGLAALAFAGAAWLVVGGFVEIVARGKVLQATFSQSLSRLLGTPLAAWGAAIAHAGMGITVAGIAGMSLSSSDIVTVQPGQTIHFSGYDWTLSGVRDEAGSNYNARVADLVVEHAGRVVAVMHPSRKSFTTQQTTTTDTAIQTNGWRDLYTVLGGERGGQAVLRLYVNPLAPWIWLGALVMAAGGSISLVGRRLRLTVSLRSRTSVPASAL